MKNVVLIGMPGAGKSTVGVLLAKTILFDFIDTDLLIQTKYCHPLFDIIESRGKQAFIKAENDVICSIDAQRTVIATGGSAVYGEKAMQHLKENGTVVYLRLPPSEIKNRIVNIKTRGIAMNKNDTIDDLYTERAPLYEKYADMTIYCSGLTPEQCVEKIIEKL